MKLEFPPSYPVCPAGFINALKFYFKPLLGKSHISESRIHISTLTRSCLLLRNPALMFTTVANIALSQKQYSLPFQPTNFSGIAVSTND